MRCQSSGSHLFKPTYPTAVRGQLLVAPDRIRRRRFEHPRKTSLGIVSKPGEIIIIIIIIVAFTGMRRLTGRCVDPQHSEAAPRTVTRTPASWGSPHRLYNNPTPELPSPARHKTQVLRYVSPTDIIGRAKPTTLFYPPPLRVRGPSLDVLGPRCL